MWQAWHKLTSTVVLCGRRGTHGTVWRAWSGFVARGAAPLCVAGVAQPDIHLRFTWQAWHKLTSTFVLRGRRGTDGTVWRAWSGFVARGAAPLCVAGVALGDIHLRFTWQAWHNLTSTFVLRGRRGTDGTGWRAWSGFVAQGAHFAWQAWHLVTSTFVSRGRRGTDSHPPSFCVASVALMVLCGALGPDLSPGAPRHFAWQAWHLVTSTFVSCGRRGANSHPPSFCVAGVALMVLCGALGPDLSPGAPRHFAWQAWHLVTSTFVSRGRRGTNSHPPSFCVAGVALMVLCGALGPDLSPGAPRHFAWQAWHLVTSTFVSCGRRGTNSHPPSFCVAGVALMVLCGALGPDLSPGAPRHFAWQAWHLVTSTFVSRGRRGTNSHPPSFCVAGVALMVLCGALGPDLSPGAPRHFAWQAWHLVTSTFVSRGRRGTNSHPPSFCVAGVTLMVLCGALGPDLSPGAPRHFAWQAWHLVTSTFVSRGRRGTNSHPLSFCVAGVAPALTHPLSHTTLSHTIFRTPSFTPNFVTHHLSRTIFHTPHCHPPSLTHPLLHTIFVTHHLSHTIFYTQLCQTASLTHQVSHTALSHTTLSHHLSPHHLPHTIFHHPIFHTQLCHTPSLTHHLSHSTLPHTVFHTQLCHMLSFTQDFHPHHLSAHHPSHTTLSHTIFHHTILHTQLCHTPTIFRHTIFHTPLCHTPSFTHNFVTHSLSHTTFTHAIFHTLLCHTHTHTHHLSHSTLSLTTVLTSRSFTASFPLTFFPRPCYNLSCLLLEEVDLWGYPVL